MRSTFILFVWCSLYFSIKLWQQSMRERERLLRAEAEVRDVRLSALRYQLNPHFLFNSLNAVSTLVLDFLDIQMPGMDGFEVLRALPKENLPGVISSRPTNNMPCGHSKFTHWIIFSSLWTTSGLRQP